MSDLPIVTTTKALADAMKDGGTDVNAGKHYSDARSSPRARDQYTMPDIAKRYLDEMEAAGRLHGLNRRKS